MAYMFIIDSIIRISIYIEMKKYFKIENSSKTGSMQVEVEVLSEMAPHGKNIVVIKPIAGKGEMRVWADRIILENNEA
jgi:hypothetical protein